MESAVAARGEVTSYGPPARLRVSEHPPHSCVRPMRGARRRLAGSSTVHTGDKDLEIKHWRCITSSWLELELGNCLAHGSMVFGSRCASFLDNS
ncbi:hypothetical protein BDA96_09G223300 [Sorghum bicolor]|uniref:Uncharacterized protein n=2 Tax=Sorghum bicolor TaxID=4558 RepID=A0A921U5U3_SORBI|nr:hypothetical protein BDA96_09G223300 [Sorghum bicolor]KXG22414.1 hypothetical protein SORBI_3009G211500 [Sorghum bicolor]